MITSGIAMEVWTVFGVLENGFVGARRRRYRAARTSNPEYQRLYLSALDSSCRMSS